MATAPTQTIQDLGIELATQSLQTLVVSPITLPSGRTLADWASFVLTCREDPEWSALSGGRAGRDKIAAKWADPEGDGWTVVIEVTGTVVGAIIEFVLSEADTTVAAGINRYAADVYAVGGTAGRVQLVKPFWITFDARVAARA